MAYIALYRKWRPMVFEDVVEQEHIVKTLKYAAITGHIAHAYLFCGTRGTGKTTMAHILSRAVNCMHPEEGNPCNECEICKGILSGSLLDVVEIDAASNNSVDNVREIRDEVIYAPSQAKYKVYIVDEVHMLSTGAFNALLKTLEEPPSHVIFILATTEPHKLPATILSRCQRFDFRRITVQSIAKRLQEIAQSSGIVVHSEALRLIARMADGAMRDAISLLDQCISIGKPEISYEDVMSIVGIVNDTFLYDVADTLKDKDISRALGLVDKLLMDGKNTVQFTSDLTCYYRDLLVCKITDRPEDIIEASHETLELMKKQCRRFEQDEIICIIKELSLLETALKWASQPRILLEVAMIKICKNSFSSDNDEIMQRLSVLERRIDGIAFESSAGMPPSRALSGIPASIPQEKTGGLADGPNEAQAANRPVLKEEKPEIEVKEPVEIAGDDKSRITSDDIEKEGIRMLEGWNALLDELKLAGKMLLYSYLLDTKAVMLDDKTIGIVFEESSKSKIPQVSKNEHFQVLEEILAKKQGSEVRVKCLAEDELNAACKTRTDEEKDDVLKKGQKIAEILEAPLYIIDG